MSKIIKLITIATVLSAIGISYTAYLLKDFPDTFDWENEDIDS